MTTNFYDANSAPDPSEWHSLSVAERIRLVRSYHQTRRIKLRNVKLHTALHVAVEQHVAQGYGPTCRTMERLQTEGLTRHEAIHAIASVLSKFTDELSNPETRPQEDFNRRMNAAIEALTATAWKTIGDAGVE